MRFDFNSSEQVATDQIKQIENIVNTWICEDHPINVLTMKKDEALQAGALAMFGEKYGEIVRVVDVPGVSMELCGGTHVNRTSELGCFKIISETGISSGIRRIEALSGQSVIEYLSDKDFIVNQLCDLLKSNSRQLFERVRFLQLEVLNKNKENKILNNELASLKNANLISSVEHVGRFSIIINELHGLSGELLQNTALDFITKLGNNSAIILGGIPDQNNKKLLFVVAFGAELVKRDLNAGKFINNIAKICAGGGGGKPNIAQAGAKNIEKLTEALNFAKEDLLKVLHDLD